MMSGIAKERLLLPSSAVAIDGRKYINDDMKGRGDIIGVVEVKALVLKSTFFSRHKLDEINGLKECT